VTDKIKTEIPYRELPKCRRTNGAKRKFTIAEKMNPPQFAKTFRRVVGSACGDSAGGRELAVDSVIMMNGLLADHREQLRSGMSSFLRFEPTVVFHA
jgi:hypothetical protein